MVAVIKPSFVLHEDDKSRPGTIFSLDVSPDGARLATAGLDQKIKVWSTEPVLDSDREADEEGTKKLLSTLGSHTGVVLCVRWSPDGHYLASGSDDNIVIVWEKDENATGRKVFGQVETNHEVWNPVRRLVGHESDVGALAWSDDGYFLASGGTDSQVLVWDAETFAIVRRITYHSGMVKGLAFDPVGEFLATQSDDRSVCIWKTSDWSLESQITEQFVDSPNASWFRRLSWSPEGAFLAVPNCVNNGVFVAGILQRNQWKSENWTSLIGHDNVADVTAFNPRCFLRDPKKPAGGNNMADVLAVAARSVISIWLTSQMRPVVVFDTIVDREVLDLSWSRDGTTLYACSSEGHIAVMHFELSELGHVAPPDTAVKIFPKWEYTKPARAPSGHAHGHPASATTGTAGRPNVLMARKGPRKEASASSALLPIPPPFAPQKITVNKDGKRRIQPAFLGLGGIVPQPITATSSASALQQTQQQSSLQAISQSHPSTGRQPVASTSRLPPGGVFQPAFSNYSNGYDTEMADANAPPARNRVALQDIGWPSWGRPQEGAIHSSLDPLSRKRKAVEMDPYDADFYPVRTMPIDRPAGRTLGGDRPVLPPYEGEVVQLRPAYVPKTSIEIPSERMQLAVPSIKTLITLKWDAESATPNGNANGSSNNIADEGDAERLEARNFEDAGRPSELGLIAKGRTQWLTYLPSAIVNATFCPMFSAISCEDKTLHVYSPTGRTLMPTVVLDSPCSFLDSAGNFLLALTAMGTLGVWDIKRRKATFRPASIQPLTSGVQPSASKKAQMVVDGVADGQEASASSESTTPVIVVTAKVKANGSPIVALSNGTTLSYDSDLESWTEIASVWWSKGSEYWESRIRSSTTATGRGTRDPVRVMESEVNDYLLAVLNGGVERRNSKSVENDPVSSSLPHDTVQLRESIEGVTQEKLGREEDWKNAMTLGHLEHRMDAAVALDSPSEYRQFLAVYARRLAEEGFRGKAEELVKDLLGPVYYKPGRDEVWQTHILNVHKHVLLKEVLGTFAKSKAFTKLVADTNEVLKKMATDPF